MINKRVAVLMGGPSTERAVSLNTGNAVLNALLEKGYTAVAIDLEPERLLEQLRAETIDVVFNAVHGRYGEDGAIQGVLELAGIPYTGSGICASAVAIDKALCKLLFSAADIPTPRYVLARATEPIAVVNERVTSQLKLPLVVKAATQGSSIGVYIVKTQPELIAAIKAAFKYSSCVVIEDFIHGRELTVAVMPNGKALPIIEIIPISGCYDYDSKYTSGATEYVVPAYIEQNLAERIQATALAVYNLVGCCGVARVDLMLANNDSYHVLEINTIPGMTATSLVPKAAAAVGISFGDLCEQLLLSVLEE